MSKKKKIPSNPDEQIVLLQENISECEFEKITNKNLVKIIKSISSHSDFNSDADKHIEKNIDDYYNEDFRHLFIATVLGIKKRKYLVKHIVNIKYDNDELDYYVEFIRDNGLKLYELKLFLINLTENKVGMMKDIAEKMKNCNLKQDHYVRCDLDKLNDAEIKIVYYVLNHNICYEPLVYNK